MKSKMARREKAKAPVAASHLTIAFSLDGFLQANAVKATGISKAAVSLQHRAEAMLAEEARKRPFKAARTVSVEKVKKTSSAPNRRVHGLTLLLSAV
jgi:hypothetical protein